MAIEFYRHQVADCSFIIADISVLGILLGAQLGIPVFLIENFRWDWVYQSQIAIDSRFAKLSKWYSEQYRVANKHFQCEPICDRQSQGIILPPISRCFRHSKTQIRSSLQLDIEDKSSQLPIVLLSLQGQTKESAVAKSLELEGVAQCLATVSGIDSITKEGNCTIIPASSYHPDLVSIADLVVAKLGYSTLGEVYRAKTRLAYLSRKWFPESSVLEEFAQRELVARELTSLENDFTDTIRQLLDIQATKSLTSLDSASMFSPVFDSIDSLHSV